MFPADDSPVLVKFKADRTQVLGNTVPIVVICA
ncbi:hypothetical protein SRABI112_05015 [Pseudomonas mediterranea]|nr:hypothetical protein SRABI112_05015 [Pseudomonas mediterranea]